MCNTELNALYVLQLSQINWISSRHSSTVRYLLAYSFFEQVPKSIGVLIISG